MDEARLCRINPSFKDVNVIDRWLEVVINDAIDGLEQNGELTTEEVYDAIERGVKQRYKTDMAFSQDHAIDVEMMRERLHRMVHEVYSMP